MPSNPDLYRRVIQEGRRRRLVRRRRIGATAAAAMVLCVTSVAALAQGGSSGPHSIAVSTSTTTKSVGETSTSDAVSTTGAPTTSTETTRVSAPTTAAPTTTVLVCRNNQDNPGCGPFRYDPPIVDRPIVGSLRLSAPSPRAGVQYALIVDATDPDGDIVSGGAPCDGGPWTITQPTFQPQTICAAASCPAPPGYGPQDPPPPQSNGPQSWEYPVTFATPGDYSIRIEVHSFSCRPGHIESRATLTLDVHVT